MIPVINGGIGIVKKGFKKNLKSIREKNSIEPLKTIGSREKAPGRQSL
jgi:hypothetical protein